MTKDCAVSEGVYHVCLFVNFLGQALNSFNATSLYVETCPPDYSWSIDWSFFTFGMDENLYDVPKHEPIFSQSQENFGWASIIFSLRTHSR